MAFSPDPVSDAPPEVHELKVDPLLGHEERSSLCLGLSTADAKEIRRGIHRLLDAGNGGLVYPRGSSAIL